jgi:hypothetical protein
MRIETACIRRYGSAGQGFGIHPTPTLGFSGA